MDRNERAKGRASEIRTKRTLTARLDKQVGIVTGGSRGIARATAEALLEAGAAV